MTIKTMIQQATNELLASGVEAAATEARFLVESLCALDRKQMLVHSNMILTDDEVASVESAVRKRGTGYPLQYLIGRWEFYGLPFEVGEGVLIPRPDTETLVDEALAVMEPIAKPAVADLCSGSGCIAVAIAKKRPDCRVMAVEVSEEAYPYLEKNIALNQTGNVAPVKADVLGGISLSMAGAFDVIVSNPPYIKTDDMEKLQREVLFEPSVALDGHRDGLYFYREITRRWKQCLKPGGVLLYEVGYNQADEVSAILLQNGFEDIQQKNDLNGIARAVSGVRTASL